MENSNWYLTLVLNMSLSLVKFFLVFGKVFHSSKRVSRFPESLLHPRSGLSGSSERALLPRNDFSGSSGRTLQSSEKFSETFREIKLIKK